MPIFIKNFTWNETESHIYILLPLNGVNTSRVAIVCTHDYLRVTFPPFIFEAILKGSVDDEKSVAKIHDGVLEFTLTKKKKELWGNLNVTDLDKTALIEKRNLAEKEIGEREARLKKNREERRSKEKNYSIKKQLEHDTEDRERVERIKEEEKNKVTDEIKSWKDEKKNVTTKRLEKPKDDKRQKRKENLPRRRNWKALKDDLPPPRQNSVLTVNFTPRVFPTAARESQAEEEQKWLEKQAAARRIVGGKIDGDKKAEECDPEWLKEKGDSFFIIGNYPAAINAYNEAIKANPQLHGAYLNRAACHLKIGNLHKAIRDSSDVLQLLNPPVASNAKLRLKALVRRGAAFCHLKLLDQGLTDYEAAASIDPQNEELRRDIAQIKNSMTNREKAGKAF